MAKSGIKEKATTQDKIQIGGLDVSTKTIAKLKMLFGILKHPKKLRVLKKIQQAGKKGISVMDIYSDEKIDLSQSHTSIMLSGFRKARLVKTTRNKKFVLYMIEPATFEALKKIVEIAEKDQILN